MDLGRAREVENESWWSESGGEEMGSVEFSGKAWVVLVELVS